MCKLANELKLNQIFLAKFWNRQKNFEFQTIL